MKTTNSFKDVNQGNALITLTSGIFMFSIYFLGILRMMLIGIPDESLLQGTSQITYALIWFLIFLITIPMVLTSSKVYFSKPEPEVIP